MSEPVTIEVEKPPTVRRHPVLLKIPDPKFSEIKELAEKKGLTPTSFCMMLIYERLENYENAA